MEAKHWFGIVAMGAVLVGGSFAFNQYEKPGATPEARPLTEGLVEAPPKIEKVEVDLTGLPPAGAPGETTPKPTPSRPTRRKKPAKPAGGDGADPAAAVAGTVRNVAGQAIVGVVKWGDKKAPRLTKIDPGSDSVCKSMYTDKPLYAERNGIVDDDMNLQGVIVYVKDVPAGNYPKRTEEIVLDQIACRYVPHVVAFQVGQKITIRNSDDTTHNVHWKSRLNGDWNLTQSTKGDIPPKENFTRPEIGTCLFKCDIHPWMEARVGVFDHPFFAVSKADGTFEIPAGLPDGRYELWAWHEKYKNAKIKGVEVKAGASTNVQFTFKKNKKNKGAIVK